MRAWRLACAAAGTARCLVSSPTHAAQDSEHRLFYFARQPDGECVFKWWDPRTGAVRALTTALECPFSVRELQSGMGGSGRSTLLAVTPTAVHRIVLDERMESLSERRIVFPREWSTDLVRSEGFPGRDDPLVRGLRGRASTQRRHGRHGVDRYGRAEQLSSNTFRPGIEADEERDGWYYLAFDFGGRRAVVDYELRIGDSLYVTDLYVQPPGAVLAHRIGFGRRDACPTLVGHYLVADTTVVDLLTARHALPEPTWLPFWYW